MPKIITEPKLIDDILTRSVAEIYPSKNALRKALLSGKRLRIYIGADATGPDLHIGHATNFILLEKLRQLGHEIIILFGDFTAMIGDPTDKEAVRKALTKEQVEEHIKTWRAQVSKIIDFDHSKNPAKILRNSKWLSKLKFGDVIQLASHFTVQRMLERDMFEQRLKNKKPIYVHEFMYPLMQGYDSVAMDVDLEVGGTDQTFNMLAGRILQKQYNNKEKFVLTTTLLENPLTGKKLMSKSEGGYIALNDTAKDMYGKVMALPDEVMVQVFIDCTYVDMEEISQIKKQLEKNEVNPRDVKMRLAREIVTLYHGKDKALMAEQEFKRVFQKHKLPKKIKTHTLRRKKWNVVDLMFESGLVKTKNEARRIITQGGLKIDGVVEKNFSREIILDKKPIILQAGKRRFVKVCIKKNY